MIEIQHTIRMFERRCLGCGRFWASELEHHGHCPSCAVETIERSKREREKLERSIRAMRAARKRRALQLAKVHKFPRSA